MAFSYKALHIRSSLTHFRRFPEPEVLTVVQREKGSLKGHFRAKVPVRKRKTALSTSRQQPTGFHRIFPSVGPKPGVYSTIFSTALGENCSRKHVYVSAASVPEPCALLLLRPAAAYA